MVHVGSSMEPTRTNRLMRRRRRIVPIPLHPRPLNPKTVPRIDLRDRFVHRLRFRFQHPTDLVLNRVIAPHPAQRRITGSRACPYTYQM